jgi:hypothetical protein
MCVNLKVRWYWIPNLTRSETLEFRIRLDIHLGVRVSLALQHPLDISHVLYDPLLDF